jgi:hypothetical protein
MTKRSKALTSVLGVALMLTLMIGTSFAGKTSGEIRADTGNSPRGYMTTPQELRVIAQKAKDGIEPYKSAVKEVIDWAKKSWDYPISNNPRCSGADDPAWIDERGAGIVYAQALAYHLTGEVDYAKQAFKRVKKVMKKVLVIPLEKQCRLNFAWGIPEWVSAADLLEDFWRGKECKGPASFEYKKTALILGDCKDLFQNWLAKNPYYIVSLSASTQSNWGAASANATAYIADYLHDRSDIVLVHRHPREMLDGANLRMSPRQAYDYANDLLFDRMNGFGVEHNGSTSCDFLTGSQQYNGLEPVKSQFSENGIIPDDTRREQYCNVTEYNGKYQNYPQLHISHTVQHCELLFRRGSRSCYDNYRTDDIPEYEFMGPDGEIKTTHLRAGRGSVERVINAVIIDSDTEWKHDAGLWVAYRYYSKWSRFDLVDEWQDELDRSGGCSQAICFGKLTHGFAQGESIQTPPQADAMTTAASVPALPLPPPPPSQ